MLLRPCPGGDPAARTTLLCMTVGGVLRLWAKLQGAASKGAIGGTRGLPSLQATGGFCQVLAVQLQCSPAAGDLTPSPPLHADWLVPRETPPPGLAPAGATLPRPLPARWIAVTSADGTVEIHGLYCLDDTQPPRAVRAKRWLYAPAALARALPYLAGGGGCGMSP